MAETLSVVAVADPPFVQNGQVSSAPSHPLDSFFIFKDKVCSTTGGVNSVNAECKTTQEDLDSLTSEEDNCRKKRCADRYDSSESSDSGVAVHCGDCGSSNSDITEPCSPLSTTSLEEMPPTQTQPSWPWSDGDPPSKRPKQGKITEYFKSKTKKLFQSSPKPGFESEKEMSLIDSSVTEFLTPSETPDFLVTPPLSREEDDDERSPPSLESSSSSTTSSSETSLKKDDHFWQTDIVAELIRRSTESKEKEENKNIRFPLKNGWRGHYVSDIICRWSDCHAKFNTTSALIEHLQVKHVNSQTLKEYFMCQWVDCKVFERKSCSRTWLERHVLSHGGNKPYRCIVDGCGHRFSSQTLLQKHVNNHFSERDQKGDSKKGCEQNNKLIRRNGKKLRYRRQPLSARIYDYFDAGVMVGLQHNLIEITEKRTQGKFDSCPGDSIILHSKIMGKRTDLNGASQVLLRWFPTNIISDEWILADKAETTRTIKIPTLPVQSKDCLNSYLLNHQRLRPTRTGRKRTTATAT